MDKKKKKKIKRRWIDLLLVLILLIGLAIVAYPSFSEYWNSFHQSRAISSYAETVATLNTEEYNKMWEEALLYNGYWAEKTNQWAIDPEETEVYNARLNVGGTGNMGFITIPRINVNLPIYHGTEESVLQTAVGHIEGTSLPVGSAHDEENFGKVKFASHCVISGHRGLPSAKLFSDLDKVEIGDLFTMNILDQTLYLCVATWEGNDISLSANMLRGIARLIYCYGDSLQMDVFIERVGKVSAKELSRMARERRNGSLGFSETMLQIYNKRAKNGLDYSRLYSRRNKQYFQMPDDEEEEETAENPDEKKMMERTRTEMEQTDLLDEMAENDDEEGTLFRC